MQNIIIALISAAASIVLATVGYTLSKKKEREADWRKKKLEMYHQLFDGIAGIVSEDVTPDGQRTFARACNTIGLIASPEVIVAVQRFQKAAKPGHSHQEHDRALTDLLRAVRKDLGLPLPEGMELTYKLWSSGINKKIE
ncbi:MAG: hypothetical protein R3C97_00550 [Geminicoccaceae bacterium]